MPTTQRMHLPVRKMRELNRQTKLRKEVDERMKAMKVLGIHGDTKALKALSKDAEARIKGLQLLGTTNTDKLVHKGADRIAREIKALPESLMRKAVHLAITLAIPKSPRGRKPAHS